MVRLAAKIFGAVLLLVGVLGFIPAFAPVGSDGMPLLLGIFMVGAVMNIVHLLSGALALAAGASDRYARLYFQVFGVVYAVVTLVGFIQGNTVLGIMPVNLADNLLHALIAAVALYLGFGLPASSKETARV